jgi:two-component system phosphate regulon sensor histidine kinase PhoR
VKTYRPISIIALGSLVVLLAVFACLLSYSIFVSEIETWALAAFPMMCAVLAFLIFYLLITKHLNQRLRLIYRNILTQKMSTQERQKTKLTNDVIGDLEGLTEELAKKKQEEDAKLKEQEKFRRECLGNISHELKTPIFSIQGYILTLLEGGLEDEVVNRKFLERASKGVDRITHILDELDTITKLESSKLETVLKPFDVIELASEIIVDLRVKAAEKNITLKKVFSTHEMYVKADKGKIGQVFTNLISNSIYYGKDEGKTEIRIYKVDGIVTIEVSDDGPGIEQENLPRLFERFYRVDKSRARNVGGTGLGLAIVKHIIDSHDQTISVRSTVGVGSTFTFTLEKG